MLLVQLATAIAICLLLAAGSMMTAQSELAALKSAQTLQFYTQDVPLTNLAIQKLVAKAISFNIYNDPAGSGTALIDAATNNLQYLTPQGGIVVRLNYGLSPVTGLYPVGFLCSVANDGIYYYSSTSTTLGGTAAITGYTCWKIVGWANNLTVGVSPPANSAPFNCFFSVSDPFDNNILAPAAGLLVTNLLINNRSITLYAERF